MSGCGLELTFHGERDTKVREVVEEVAELPCVRCGWCLDCLRIERMRSHSTQE